jgi:hypothetical protein
MTQGVLEVTQMLSYLALRHAGPLRELVRRQLRIAQQLRDALPRRVARPRSVCFAINVRHRRELTTRGIELLQIEAGGEPDCTRYVSQY